VPHASVVLEFRLGKLELVDQPDRRADIPGSDFSVHGHTSGGLLPVDLARTG
jgi:hypothetical protein